MPRPLYELGHNHTVSPGMKGPLMNLRRKFGIAATVALTCLTSLTALAPTASAASCTMTPTSLNLYDKARAVTFNVPGQTYWSVEITDLYVYAYVDEYNSSAVSTLSPRYFSNSDAGAHDAHVVRASDGTDCVATFHLRRGANLSLSAKHVGSYRQFSGRLRRVQFDVDGGLSNVSGAKVAIQRKTSHGSWVTVKTVTTGKDGKYSGRVKIGKHTWRTHYAGTGTTGARSSGPHTA